jgi:hypothetical protein
MVVEDKLIYSSEVLKSQKLRWTNPSHPTRNPRLKVYVDGSLDSVEIYAVFLRRSTIVTLAEARGENTTPTLTLTKEDCLGLVAAWHFGHDLKDEVFQGMILDFLGRELQDHEDASAFIDALKVPGLVQKIWDATDSLPLQNLVVNTVTDFRTVKDADEFSDPGQYPVEFCLALYQAEARARNKQGLSKPKRVQPRFRGNEAGNN